MPVDPGWLAQANAFSTRAWDVALKAATELGLAQQAEDAASRLQTRKAAVVLALQNMSSAGFQNAKQASGDTHLACMLLSARLAYKRVASG